MTTGTIASIHRGLGFLFLGLALIMFFLAGLGSFGEGFDAHRMLGMAMIPVALVLLVLAAVGRREALVPSGVLLVLMILQSVLAVAGREGAPVLGALHAVNALVILVVGHQVARGLPLPSRSRPRGSAGATPAGPRA